MSESRITCQRVSSRISPMFTSLFAGLFEPIRLKSFPAEYDLLRPKLRTFSGAPRIRAHRRNEKAAYYRIRVGSSQNLPATSRRKDVANAVINRLLVENLSTGANQLPSSLLVKKRANYTETNQQNKSLLSFLFNLLNLPGLSERCSEPFTAF